MTLNIFTEKGTPFFLGIFFPLKSWLFHIHDLGYFHRKRLPFLARVYFNKKVIPSALYFILGVFFTHCYAVFRHHSSFCWQQLEDHQARLFPRRTCTMPTRKIKKSYKKVLALLHVHDLGYFHRKKDPPFFARVSDLFWQSSTQVLSRLFKTFKIKKKSMVTLEFEANSVLGQMIVTQVCTVCHSFAMIDSSHSFTNPESTIFLPRKRVLWQLCATIISLIGRWVELVGTLAGTPLEKLERKYSELSIFHKIWNIVLTVNDHMKK